MRDMIKQPKHFYEFGPFRLDATEHLLSRAEGPVPLEPKAFEMLLVLVQNSGRILGREELLRTLWPGTAVDENNLNQQIARLRKALGEDGNGSKYIETVPRRGYRFVVAVSDVIHNSAEGAPEMLKAAPVAREETPSEGASAVQPVPGSGVTLEGAAHADLAERPGSDDREGLPPAVLPGPRRRPSGRNIAIAFLLLIGAAGTGAYVWRTSPPKPPVKLGESVRSLAVLPFKPLVAEESDRYLELGMADTLITRLSNLRQIIVRPTTTVLKFTGSGQDLRATGRELEVDALLDGKVQRAGDRIRVSVQLVRARDGVPLWADTFDAPFTNIFTVQDMIAEQVTRALMLRLTGTEQQQLTKRPTQDTEAYRLYLMGRYFWNKRTEDGDKKSITYFEQAIEKDPGYAPAYAGLADAYAFIRHNEKLLPREAFQKAKTVALRALEIDGTLAEARAALGRIRLLYDWDWPAAEKEFQTAIELNPNYATAHHFYAICLMTLGRHAEALAEIQRAQELDPLSLLIRSEAGSVLYHARRYDQAIEQFRKTLDMDPNFPPVHTLLAWTYEQKGMYDEAVAEYLKAKALSGESPQAIAALKEIYTASGLRGYWQKHVEGLRPQPRQRYIGMYDVAAVYARLGEKDLALEWLERAYADRSHRLVFLKVAPRWDGLRSDPRFADLMRRVGLSP